MNELLVASHIKPWSISDANEKLDIHNGLLMCPNHDKLFDRGYISFDDTGRILISEKLDDNNSYDENRYYRREHKVYKISQEKCIH